MAKDHTLMLEILKEISDRNGDPIFSSNLKAGRGKYTSEFIWRHVGMLHEDGLIAGYDASARKDDGSRFCEFMVQHTTSRGEDFLKWRTGFWYWLFSNLLRVVWKWTIGWWSPG